MQTTKPLTNEEISNHVWFLSYDKDWTKEESVELTERFIDTFGESDDETV